jgi:hypothetical protein
MPKKRQFAREPLVQTALSQEFHAFLTRNKSSREEPLYRVADRVMYLYKATDKAELEEKSQRQAKIIDIYHSRIKELEAQLEQKQMTFTFGAPR